ncbi:MAG: LysM protein [Marmoricola sp.]|jgi:nucleoid-associated protein YgaU|nr:LysM protein [Marmoricola sp.]
MVSLGKHPGFSTLLTSGAATVVLLGCCWLALLVIAAAIEAITHGHSRALRFTGCPVAWRGWLLGVCGAVIVAGTAAPTYAASQGTSPNEVDGLPLPGRTVGAVVEPTRRTVVVRPGDSLWRIAERDLPATAGPARIDQLWRRIAARNGSVIGPDPDLIQPGQRLVLPSTSDSEERS